MAKKKATVKPKTKKLGVRRTRRVPLLLTPVPFVKIYEVATEPVLMGVDTTIRALVRKEAAHVVRGWVIDVGTDAEPPADDVVYDLAAGLNGVYALVHAFAAAHTYVVRIAIVDDGATPPAIIAEDSISIEVV